MKQINKKIRILIAMLCVSITVYAYDYFEVDNIKYHVTSESEPYTCEVGKVDYFFEGASANHSKYSGDIEIPDKVKHDNRYYTVTGITSFAFNECTALTSVTIPNTVTYIDPDAFYGCSMLTQIDVDQDNPVYASIDGIVYNKSITSLVMVPKGITTLDMPESVSSINEHAARDCSKLKSVNFPSSIKSIGYGAFSHCIDLTSLEIPNSVTSIDNAFHECYGLTSITIPNSVTSMDGAFLGCSRLTSITIPNSVTSIGSRTFFMCERLESVIIPSSVTSIGEDAFSSCMLTSINIPSSVTYIGDHAFMNCLQLDSVTIPSNITHIGYGAFFYCKSLTAVQYLTNNPISLRQKGDDSDEGGVFFGWDVFGECDLSKATLIVCSEGIENAYHEYRWQDFGKITCLAEDEDYSYECHMKGGEVFMKICDYKTIKDINLILPDEALGYPVDAIGNNVFAQCSDFVSVVIPETVTEIGEKAFYRCADLAKVSIPASVKTIGEMAFNSCVDIDDIVYLTDKPVWGEKNMFSDIVYSQATVRFAEGGASRAKKIEPWCYFSNVKEQAGINGIEDEDCSISSIYDLQGRKVIHPVKGRLYIINGKKAVL